MLNFHWQPLRVTKSKVGELSSKLSLLTLKPTEKNTIKVGTQIKLYTINQSGTVLEIDNDKNHINYRFMDDMLGAMFHWDSRYVKFSYGNKNYGLLLNPPAFNNNLLCVFYSSRQKDTDKYHITYCHGNFSKNNSKVKLIANSYHISSNYDWDVVDSCNPCHTPTGYVHFVEYRNVTGGGKKRFVSSNKAGENFLITEPTFVELE